MENVAPTPIDKLKPYVKAERIKVQNFQKYTTLHSILLDEMVRKHYFSILITTVYKDN